MKCFILILCVVCQSVSAEQIITGRQDEIIVSIDEITTVDINLDMTNRCYQVYGNDLPPTGDRAHSVDLFDGVLYYDGLAVGNATIIHAVMSYELSISFSGGFAVHTYTCKFSWE